MALTPDANFSTLSLLPSWDILDNANTLFFLVQVIASKIKVWAAMLQASRPMVNPTLNRINMDILTAFSDDNVSYVPLTKNQYAIVDTEHLELVSQFKWHYANGYASRNNCQKASRMHRLIFFAHHGIVEQKTLDIDHINRDRLDNRIENLRLATRSQNGMNRESTCANTSGYKGVFRRDSGAWISKIKVQGEIFYLGQFASPEQAALAYNEAALRLHGSYAVLNDVKGVTEFSRIPPPKGVYLHRGRWNARVTEYGKRIHVGCFGTEEEAIAARKKHIESRST